MFSTGQESITFADLKRKVSDAELISYYLGITEIPCIITSPLREDKHPSFGLYSSDGMRINWVDLATKDRGGVYDLLAKMWKCSYREVLNKVNNDLGKFSSHANVKTHVPCIVRDVNSYNEGTDLECKVREWKQWDIDYWGSYGISLEWLQYAEVYPISHKIVIKGGKRYVMGADKYAYAYVEHKEGRVTLKIYQPFNKQGFKWSNKHDRSVISLWTKVPEYGEKIVVCSSMKDALCLWANTGIPAVAIQGEGYGMSDTAVNELRRRYRHVFIMLDNDSAGREDAVKLSEATGFTNVVLPAFDGGKDISDYYKVVGKDKFLDTLLPLFEVQEEWDDLPF